MANRYMEKYLLNIIDFEGNTFLKPQNVSNSIHLLHGNKTKCTIPSVADIRKTGTLMQ